MLGLGIPPLSLLNPPLVEAMTTEQASELVEDFLSTDHVAEGWSDPSEHYVWEVLTCELYFRGRPWRCRYLQGQEFGDYKFNLVFIADSFADLKAHPEKLVDEIMRVAGDLELETIFISDRMFDGDVDYFSWQR